LTEFVAADVLAAWAGGLAGAAAIVALWRVVGPGFLWLAALTASLFGLPSLLLDFGAASAIGAAALVIAVAAARNPVLAAGAFAVAAGGFTVAAMGSGVLGALSAAVFLGGITGEMILGHWYLVDPRLPRWALFRLDGGAMFGLVAELAVLGGLGAFGWAAADQVIGWAFVGLAVATGVLLAAVWFSLKEPAYPAVMAATGLSYLAVLTAIGTSVAGRILAEAAG
jgi:hypothetical protein